VAPGQRDRVKPHCINHPDKNKAGSLAKHILALVSARFASASAPLSDRRHAQGSGFTKRRHERRHLRQFGARRAGLSPPPRVR
jgi:hypothetical protein